MNRGVVIGAASAVGFVAGAVAGYYFAKHRLSEYYKVVAEKEIQDAREYYMTISKKGAEDINEVAAQLVTEEERAQMEKDAVEAMRTYQGKKPATSDPRVELLGGTNPPMDMIIQNVFNTASGHDEPSPEELRSRTEEAPYIITKTEYMESGMEYEQVTLTYYQGDKTLCEEDDTIVEEVDEAVGEENLNHFGHTSGDPNVLYVRNDYFEKDYEILRHGGSYSEVVAGLTGD